MNHQQFLKEESVISFIRWLSPQLKTLPIKLKIPNHQRFVPGGVNVDVIGLEAVTSAYIWRSTGLKVGDWDETTSHCSTLSNAIQVALAGGSNTDTLEAAWNIIQWGGGHKSNGAYQFFSDLGNELVPYLRRTKQAFTLSTADTTVVVPPVMAMNSMMTKVHAFLATDGLPIYDSRVAVSITTLVETWRRATIQPAKLMSTPIPEAIHFPTVNARNSSRATVLRRFPDAKKPKHLYQYNAVTAAAWSSAKIRLGWLMEALLIDQPALFADSDHLTDRMRALEAALFMIGYDVRCLQ